MRAPSMKPVKPYITPASVKTRMVVAATFTPETFAASGLEPTANMFLPKVVLFQTNHITTVITMAYHTKLGMGTILPLPSGTERMLPVMRLV